MDSQSMMRLREDGAPCSVMEFTDGTLTSRKAPRKEVASSEDPAESPGMRFAFVIHPISDQTKDLMDLDRDGRLRNTWGRSDLLGFCAEAHEAFEVRSQASMVGQTEGPRIVDTFAGLVSATGARAEGRLYQIPMDARSILNDPDRALVLLEQVVADAVGWGAQIVGLGSMTGVIGDHGAFLAERHPIAVTTGNSLTVHAAVRNLEHYCESLDIDLAEEEIAVVGIPGSIASAVGALLAPRCRRLVACARRTSPRATQWAKRLGARLEVELPRALADASIVVTATSSGNCIDPKWLRPGCMVLDVGVPSDVRRVMPARDDVLILSAGYARVPSAMPRESFFLRFYHGIVPSCLGETMVLALENRAVSFSIGRDLSLDRVREIGPPCRGARLCLLGGAGVRPSTQSRGPIAIPQGALEDATSAVAPMRPPGCRRRIRQADRGAGARPRQPGRARGRAVGEAH